MMGFENLEKAKTMLEDAKTLKTAKASMLKKADENSRMDKYGIGFGLDSRFSMFSATVSFDSWTGYYGSSSCSTFVHANNNEEVVKSFHAYIKSHEDEILNWMAYDLIIKAKNLKANIESEITEIKKSLDDLDQDLKGGAT